MACCCAERLRLLLVAPSLSVAAAACGWLLGLRAAVGGAEWSAEAIGALHDNTQRATEAKETHGRNETRGGRSAVAVLDTTSLVSKVRWKQRVHALGGVAVRRSGSV